MGIGFRRSGRASISSSPNFSKFRTATRNPQSIRHPIPELARLSGPLQFLSTQPFHSIPPGQVSKALDCLRERAPFMMATPSREHRVLNPPRCRPELQPLKQPPWGRHRLFSHHQDHVGIRSEIERLPCDIWMRHHVKPPESHLELPSPPGPACGTREQSLGPRPGLQAII